MLALGKKMDYALISLAWLAERSGRAISAREIAEANDLPLPALMQILKTLHQHGMLRSTRGVKGGYRSAPIWSICRCMTLERFWRRTRRRPKMTIHRNVIFRSKP